MSELVNTGNSAELEIMPSFDFTSEVENEQQAKLTEHRAWLKNIRHEHPLPQHHFKVAVYIRYFNQTKYEDYLDFHKKQFLKTIELCPNWTFMGFYVDEGANPPNMENAEAWSRLLGDSYDGKIDLIITQKASNISKKPIEITFCARMLAALPNPVGIYFVSEDIYTLATYYQEDLKDTFFLPTADWQIPPDDEPDLKGILDA